MRIHYSLHQVHTGQNLVLIIMMYFKAILFFFCDALAIIHINEEINEKWTNWYPNPKAVCWHQKWRSSTSILDGQISTFLLYGTALTSHGPACLAKQPLDNHFSIVALAILLFYDVKILREPVWYSVNADK